MCALLYCLLTHCLPYSLLVAAAYFTLFNTRSPYWHANSYFTGKMDHVTYWDSAIPAEQVQREALVMPDGESCLPAILHLTANFGDDE